jgi:tetratricopeptide (TPR) repeat protein
MPPEAQENKMPRFIGLCLLIAFTGPACLATAPIHPQARQHNRTGVTHLQSGRLHRAEVCFQLSLEYNPCHSDSLHNLALIYLMRKDLATAESKEREALDCNPDLVQAVNGLGVIRKEQGDPQEALELFEQAVQMDPGYLDARRNLILTALDLGKTKRARIHADRLSMLSPGDPVVALARNR